MVKRVLSCEASDFLGMSKYELKQAILASEGRTIMAENVSSRMPIYPPVTNAEVERAAGADMILFNGLDCHHPLIDGVPATVEENHISWIKKAVGRPVGVNLEPVDETEEVMDEREILPKGRTASQETFEVASQLGFDFICLTGNPGTGVSNEAILKAIQVGEKSFSGLIIAGKMHSAGIDEIVMSKKIAAMFIEAGVDILLVPAPYTVPFFREKNLYEIVEMVKEHNEGKGIEEKVLVMAANGTSQDSSDIATIKKIGLSAKAAGADIQHIGDSFNGIALPQNIYALGEAIRGSRHQVTMLARSIIR